MGRWDREWKIYSMAKIEGRLPSQSEAKFIHEIHDIGLSSIQGGSSLAVRIVEEYKAKSILKELLEKDAYELKQDTERLKFEVGMQFLNAVDMVQLDDVKRIATSGFNVNFQHPRRKRCALQTIAFSGSKRLLRAFLSAEEAGSYDAKGAPIVDFLVKDNDGRLPSVLALNYNSDVFMHRYLRMREKKQLQEQNEHLGISR